LREESGSTGAPPMTPSGLGELIVAEARKLTGTAFYHAGRDEHGIDCAGLILACWHRLGLTDWDDRGYAPGSDGERLEQGLKRFCVRIDLPGENSLSRASPPFQIEPGDVLLFALRGHPVHIALATGEGTMIHAVEAPVGKVVEVPLDERWRQLLVGVWRWREATNWHHFPWVSSAP
jgi:cell wall-associated NlpC family hydrolase